MTGLRGHGEWLSMVDVSGPFLAEPVLKQAFPQGLEQTDPSIRKQVRQAYDEWREAVDTEDSHTALIHDAWTNLVLKRALELDEDGEGDVLRPASQMPVGSLAVPFPEHGVMLQPDFAVVDAQNDDRCCMFVAVYPPDTELSAPVKGDKWAASPAERMVELCRARDVRLGLVTNGERWMLVDAPVGGVTSFASWYAHLWGQEPITLQAFVSLLGIRRFFVDTSEQLPALLDESLKLQDEVTDALGKQVRRAVEVLVQALDRADVDRNRELLVGVEPPELYEAALTVLMRIVFLLSAEERALLLSDDERYQAFYAVSTLRMQLRAESEEILERRQDAWSRLLAVFRAVFGGIKHEALRLPALGGSLFDPDRFPFLEGRAKGTSWKHHPAAPLPIDNHTVLLLLDAVQLFEGRTLSYRALDVEQIGYVYEGLLERTVIRAREITLDLAATKSAKNPWVTLGELETEAGQGAGAVQALLQDRTGSSASRVKNDLAKPTDESAADRLLVACHGDLDLRDRVKPYLHFLRVDPWGYPLVYPKDTFMVTAGADRRETGTHYTPKSLTEAIVKETLRPLVYVGPAEGQPSEDWTIRSPGELLDLRICDPAMGSGAFLVQVCRWLSERLVEAWSDAEAAGRAITAEGEVVDYIGRLEPLRSEPEDRLLTARRLIAERCLYGVDMNPLAVELAKLSIWLITLAKGRPFGFLDHNLRCGDSLLGIHDLDQLLYLEMAPGRGSSRKLFAARIDAVVERALALRAELRNRPIRDIRDVELMASLDERARRDLEVPELIADAFIGDLLSSGVAPDTVSLSIDAGKAIDEPIANATSLAWRAKNGLRADLPNNRPSRYPFHWPLAFPDVLQRNNSGFDAIVGNPPFSGGKKITTNFGKAYRDYLVRYIAEGTKGSADLVAYFYLRAFRLLRKGGCFGLLAVNTIAEGDTRQVGLERLLKKGAVVFAAFPNEPWPGKANVITSRVHLCKDRWKGICTLGGKRVEQISAYLSSRHEWSPQRLKANKSFAFQGSNVLGLGFTMSKAEARRMIAADPRNAEVVLPYLSGQDLNSHPRQEASRWIVSFWDWPEERAVGYPLPYRWIKDRVYPERLKKSKSKSYRNIMSMWWKHWNNRIGMYHAIGCGENFAVHPRGWSPVQELESVICNARVGKYFSPSQVPNGQIFHDKVVVFALQGAG